VEWITRILPHRYPMLLIDRVLELEPKRIVCLKNLTNNEAFFQGHFPGRPVMPGVYTIEALAQAAGLLLMSNRPDLHGKVIFFTGIDNARFRRPVVPGDQLRLEVEVLRTRGSHAKLLGKAFVDGQLAVEAVCSSMFAPD
jgi:beta-hydroxyacyl-ACP dehydratase FabZ